MNAIIDSVQHEIAHFYGLEHSNGCKSIMNIRTVSCYKNADRPITANDVQQANKMQTGQKDGCTQYEAAILKYDSGGDDGSGGCYTQITTEDFGGHCDYEQCCYDYYFVNTTYCNGQIVSVTYTYAYTQCDPNPYGE